MNRKERRASGIRMLKAGEKAYPRLPDAGRAIVDADAERLKGQPWAAVMQTLDNYRTLALSATDTGIRTRPAEHIERANAVFSLFVAGLLERLGADPKRCDDTFQANVYMNAARADYRKAGERYRDKAGGVEALKEQAKKWYREHGKDLKDVPTALVVGAGKGTPEPWPLDTMEQCLTRWTENARATFAESGAVSPLAVGVMPDGQTMRCSCESFRSKEENETFWNVALSHFHSIGAIRFIRVAEIWFTPESCTVPPSQATERQEGVFVEVRDFEQAVATVSPIERDWQSGTPSLQPAHRLDATA